MQNIESNDMFNNAINKDNTTIVKFEANWCPDCRYMDTFIDEIVDENQDKNWYNINSDDFMDLAQQYKVMGIPSLLVFKDGEKKAHLHSANAKTPDQVRDFLKTV